MDLECPLEAGELVITKNVDLPAEIPPVRSIPRLHTDSVLIDEQGKYTVLADVFTADDVQITCLTATVAFSRGSFFSNEDEL